MYKSLTLYYTRQFVRESTINPCYVILELITVWIVLLSISFLTSSNNDLKYVGKLLILSILVF
jgi:hypothetical protein